MFSSVIYLKLILDRIWGWKILPPPPYRESNFPSTFYLILCFLKNVGHTHGMWNLSSPTRYWTHDPTLEGWALTPRPLRKPPPGASEKAALPICYVAPLSQTKWLFTRSLFQEQLCPIQLFAYLPPTLRCLTCCSSYQVLTSSTMFFSTSAVFFEDALIILGLWFSYQFQKSVTESWEQCGESWHSLTTSAAVWRTLLLPRGGHGNS